MLHKFKNPNNEYEAFRLSHDVHEVLNFISKIFENFIYFATWRTQFQNRQV